MANVPGSELAINGFMQASAWPINYAIYGCEQLIEGGAFAKCDVVDLIECFRARSDGRQEIRLDDIGNVAEITGRFSITIDIDRLALDQGSNPLRHYRGVTAGRVLPWAEHIEVTKPNALKAVSAAEHIRIQFIHDFSGRVRRQ